MDEITDIFNTTRPQTRAERIVSEAEASFLELLSEQTSTEEREKQIKIEIARLKNSLRKIKSRSGQNNDLQAKKRSELRAKIFSLKYELDLLIKP